MKQCSCGAYAVISLPKREAYVFWAVAAVADLHHCTDLWQKSTLESTRSLVSSDTNCKVRWMENSFHQWNAACDKVIIHTDWLKPPPPRSTFLIRETQSGHFKTFFSSNALGWSRITHTFATGNTGALRGNVGFQDIISFAKRLWWIYPRLSDSGGIFPHSTETTPATVTHSLFLSARRANTENGVNLIRLDQSPVTHSRCWNWSLTCRLFSKLR